MRNIETIREEGQSVYEGGQNHEEMYICYIACERLNKKQIAVFNICDHNHA